jgi:hypothetical protein
MLIVKTEKKLGSPNSFRRYNKCNMPPFLPYGAVLTLFRVTGTIAIAQPLLNFLNKDPTKNVYLVIIYKKTWFLSESKTIDVHCRGAKMSFPIFSDMLFWEACAKNVKYYKMQIWFFFYFLILHVKRIEEQKYKIKSRVTYLLKKIQGLNMQHDVEP